MRAGEPCALAQWLPSVGMDPPSVSGAHSPAPIPGRAPSCPSVWSTAAWWGEEGPVSSAPLTISSQFASCCVRKPRPSSVAPVQRHAAPVSRALLLALARSWFGCLGAPSLGGAPRHQARRWGGEGRGLGFPGGVCFALGLLQRRGRLPRTAPARPSFSLSEPSLGRGACLPSAGDAARRQGSECLSPALPSVTLA